MRCDLASGREMAAYVRPRYALDTGTAIVINFTNPLHDFLPRNIH